MRTLNVIQNESMRNIFAHFCITSDAKTLTFIGRSSSGPYKAKKYNFAIEEFGDVHFDKANCIAHLKNRQTSAKN